MWNNSKDQSNLQPPVPSVSLLSFVLTLLKMIFFYSDTFSVLVLSLIGSIISSILQIVYCKWDQTGSKFRIKRSLAYILIGTAGLSFFASFVTLAAGHITGSEIGNRIREATSNALQLTKLKGVTINIFRNGVDTGQTARVTRYFNFMTSPSFNNDGPLVCYESSHRSPH